MTDSSSQPNSNPDKDREYLTQVLAMNPVYQSDEILKLRNQFLGVISKEQQAFTDRVQKQELRQKATDGLKRVRAQMWKQSPENLSVMIQAIDVSQLPDMRGAVERLKTVVRHHADFQALSQHPLQHINMTNTLKRAVMLPPKEAGSLKESYLRKIVEQPDLKQIQKMVAMMETQFPAVYALESDWLGEISRLSRRKKRIISSGDSAESYQTGIPGWIIWIGFVILIRIILVAVRQGSTS